MKFIEPAKQLDDVKREFDELFRRYKYEAYKAGYSNLGEYLRKIEYPEYKELNPKALSIRQRLRVLEQRNSNKASKAIELFSKHIDEGNKTFVFTNLVSQAKKNILRTLERSMEAKVGLARELGYSGCLRKAVLDSLISTTVLDEGIDVLDADVAIVVSSRALRHPRQFVQRIGRIVRLKPNKVSYVYIMRSKGGIEEETIDELQRGLDRVCNLMLMEKLIDTRMKTASKLEFIW